MKKHLTLTLFIILALTIMLAGCSTTPDIQEINEIPANAQEIMAAHLFGQSGTYTEGSVYVSGNGYIILDIQLQSGSVKSVGIKDATKDEIIFSINNPKTALYDSAIYEYKADGEYKLSFVDAKELQGSITVYFVAE